MDRAGFIVYSEKKNDRKNGFLFFAPGRVNLIGDHTDYTGGFVLPVAIQLGTYLFIKLIPEKIIHFKSNNINNSFVLKFDDLGKPTKTWVDYPLGVINQLQKHGWQPQGMELTYFGDIPIGAGLSSSASIEMVTAHAINTVFKLNLSRKMLSLLSQKAENDFVGLQSGIMDQYAVGMSENGKALLIDCHNITHKTVKVSFDDYSFVVINTNKKRALLNSVYNRYVSELSATKQILNNTFDIPYLGILTPDDAEWLDKLITDELLLKRLRHVVNENARVKFAAEYLENNQPVKFGEMMNLSHESLVNDFEVSCIELDTLVKIALETEGVVGARMTGAGFGGCTINLIHKDAIDIFTKRIKEQYKKITSLNATLYNISISGELRQL